MEGEVGRRVGSCVKQFLRASGFVLIEGDAAIRCEAGDVWRKRA